MSHSAVPMNRARAIMHQLQPRLLSGGSKSGSAGPLDEERANPTFPVRELTFYLDGGEAITNIREMVQASIEEDPVLNDKSRFDLPREEARRRCMAKINQVVSVIRGRNADAEEDEKAGKKPAKEHNHEADQGNSRAGAGKAFEDAFYGTLGQLDPSWAIRIGVHYGLFQAAINGGATEAQKTKWSRDIQEMRMIGSYCLTEMGHGSNVQGVETTATYDPATQEFIINTPTLTATKWWIGMMGQTATHGAVFAKLIINGVNHGLQTFIVPIRDQVTGQTVENVSAGDMGSKMGRNGLDNGWVQFHNKRVPRENMLMRWAQVSTEGKFTPPPSKQIAYNSLIQTRVELFKYTAEELKKALSIAIRYALVRKQFPKKGVNPTGEETKLLDYPTHQAKLFPILATTFCFHFTAVRLGKLMEMIFQNLEANLEALPALHATSSGLKAIGTWFTNDAIETCRQSLGGMGYSSYSVLPGMRADWAVMCTWEGDNTVLSLQCAKFLIKQCLKLRSNDGSDAAANNAQQRVKGKINTSSASNDAVAYLKHYAPGSKIPATMSAEQWRDHAFQLAAFEHRAARRINEVSTLISNDAKQSSFDVAMEKHSVACIELARLHCYTFLLQCFNQGIKKAPQPLKPILKLLCDLFALHEMQEHLSDFIEDGYFGSAHTPALREQVRMLYTQLRPSALPLVDAFNLPDFVIESPLGRYDGDAYNKLFEMVKAAPRAQGVPSYFQELVRPLTDKDFVPPPQP